MGEAEAPPRRLAQRPRDKHGRPVPFFVAWVDGAPDFRVIDGQRMREVLAAKLCWVCGKPRGAEAWFVIGPMCAVNRTSAEPPSHRDCAMYSATHCPFLTKPRMHRRENALPDGVEAPAGTGLRRNPGVTLVWRSAGFETFRPPNGGLLFDIGDPVDLSWLCEGRPATREEVSASIYSGLPLLQDECDKEPVSQRPAARRALEAAVVRAHGLLPS